MFISDFKFDANYFTGINPKDIRGTKTGVFVGLMTNETSDFFERTPEQMSGYETIGAIRSMLANRISFQFNFKGKIVNTNLILILILTDYSEKVGK